MKVSILLIAACLLSSLSGYACVCGYEGIVNNFQESAFVAKARIIKITPDPANDDYHDAVIEVIRLYKGEQIRKIKILSDVHSSCYFLPKENTTWVIFAQVWQGKLSFGFCSGSLQLDREYDPKYPNAAKNWAKTVARREGVVAFLSEQRIFDPNPNAIRAYNYQLDSLKGFENKNSFAAFQVDVTGDYSIAAIKQLKKFDNRRLNALVFASMKKNLKLAGRRGRPLHKPARLVVFCFYYQANGSEKSFLSFSDM